VTQQLNRLRWRAIVTARAFKELFFAPMLPRRWLTRWLWRWLLRADDGVTLRRVGEAALADLRDYCFADSSAFDPDPIIMARRQGRRDVWLRITKYLNLDEAQVQQLMEIDDGYGG
jgi:hypothetical protein